MIEVPECPLCDHPMEEVENTPGSVWWRCPQCLTWGGNIR